MSLVLISVPSDSHLTLLIEQVEDAELGLDQVDAGLVVVEVYERPGDLLLHVLLLLQFEHVLQRHNDGSVNVHTRPEHIGSAAGRHTHRVELLLKLLVGVVDAELLKTVHLERLEPAITQTSE